MLDKLLKICYNKDNERGKENKMNCKDCSFWYQGIDDDFPQCHCLYDDVAPCEYDEDFSKDSEEYEEIY